MNDLNTADVSNAGASNAGLSSADRAALVHYIRDSVIGRDEVVDGPFGPKPVIYADYTASGRSLSFIEDYIRSVVLPLYANTHTESSGTGLQTSRFRDEARQIIAKCVGATHEHAILFCGSGSTAAIDRLIGVLGLRVPSVLEDTFGLSNAIPADQRPVVFIGPYEHHSNELPWRESIADVVTIPEDADGHVSLEALHAKLEDYKDRTLKIGSFSAASNVTGIMTDTTAVSSLLHAHGALAFWDFAAAAPYVGIEMGSAPSESAEANGDLSVGGYFDAIFVSPHKLIGGPGTPGLLVARREMFQNRVPDVPGGGTVRFVNPNDHGYLDDIEHREEGGTPAIVESIRAGLVFGLKDAVGVQEIHAREEVFVRKAISSWETNQNIEILGSRDADRLSIISFVVKHTQGHLHHNFVVAVLNDLFGIQSRGGCSCAGPYGHRLLGIDLEQSREFEREIERGCEGIKPGWIRVNFNYFIDDETADYLIDAVHLVASKGHHLLPLYHFDPASGLWRHRDGLTTPPMSLLDITFDNRGMAYTDHRERRDGDTLASYLEQAEHVLDDALVSGTLAQARPETTEDFEHLRWFPYPEG